MYNLHQDGERVGGSFFFEGISSPSHMLLMLVRVRCSWDGLQLPNARESNAWCKVYIWSGFDWLVDWLIGWLVDWLIDWLIGWLIDWLIDRLIDWLIDWLIDRSIDRSIDWLIDWCKGSYLQKGTNNQMNRDEVILVSRNVFGVSPGCYISMNSFLGRKNLHGFFRRDLPRESGKCMIQFDDDNFKWVGRKHQLNFVFFAAAQLVKISMACESGLEWMFSLTLLASELCCRGTWSCWEYGHHLLTVGNFMGRRQATKWKRTKHITFFSRWWFQGIFLSLPRFLRRWSYLVNISQLGWFNHQLVLVVPSSFFFQSISVQKLARNSVKKTFHPKIGWYFFNPLGP